MVGFLPKILGDAQETALLMGTAFKAVEIQGAGKQWGNLPLTCLRHQQSQHMWSGTINFVERRAEMRSLGKDSLTLSLSSKPWLILRKGNEWRFCLPLRLGMLEKWRNEMAAASWYRGPNRNPSVRSGHKCGAPLLSSMEIKQPPSHHLQKECPLRSQV